MPPKKKPNPHTQAIVEKAQELNALFAKLPKTDRNKLIIGNVNQAVDTLIREN